MARTPKAAPPPPTRRGRTPKAAAPAAEAPAEAEVAADAPASTGVAAAEDQPPARGRRGRKPKPQQQEDAAEPALPLEATGADQVAAEASPAADGPEPAGDEDDTMIADMAAPVSTGPGDPSGGEADKTAQAGDAAAAEPAKPAAHWDRASGAVSFDWPAIERTAAQDGPNQAIAKLLVAARAEGANSRWPF